MRLPSSHRFNFTCYFLRCGSYGYDVVGYAVVEYDAAVGYIAGVYTYLRFLYILNVFSKI